MQCTPLSELSLFFPETPVPAPVNFNLQSSLDAIPDFMTNGVFEHLRLRLAGQRPRLSFPELNTL